MNEHTIDHRLDQAIDALNNEASPAPYEQGDRELFSLVDTARLARSLRDPAEPDANFPQLAIDRITADLRQTAPGNGIPPAATPAISETPETQTGEENPRGPIPFFRRHAQLAAIIAVLLLVGGGLLIYQSLGPDDDGSPAVGVPDEDDAVVADATPTASDPDEDVEPVPAVTELRIEGMLCCGAVHGVVDGESYMFLLSQAGAMHVVHVDELGSLEHVGSLETPVSITPSTLALSARVAFDDGIFYAPLPNDETPGLWIVDVTDPANPVELALVETELPPMSVAASNGVAAVAPMSFTGPLYVFDVSDPANAELVGEHDFSVASMPPAMEFDESLLYLTGRSGVVLIDLTDPDNPNDIGSFPNPDWEGPPTSGQTSTGMMDDSEFRDATLMDDHLVIAAANAGIRIIDVSDPANLQEVSHLDFEYPVFRVAATDTELYVLDTSIGSPGAAPMSEPHRIHTVDVSDIANPQITQSTLGPDGGMVQWLLTVNDTLYLLDYGIIRMFDAGTDESNSPDAQPEVVMTPDESGRCVASNLVEAQAMSAFPLVLPDDLPDGVELDAILLEHWAAVEPVVDCEGADYVTTWYQVTVGTEQHSPIQFAQTTFEPQFDGDDAQVMEVSGREVTRYSNASEDDTTIHYVWAHDVVSYVLIVPPQSPIAESDLLQMIESIPIPDTGSLPADEGADDTTIERFREVQQEVEFDVGVPVELAGFPESGGSVDTSGPPDAPSVMAMFIDNSSQPPRMFSLNQRPGGFGADPDRSDHEAEDVTIQGIETTLYTRTTPGQDGTELDIHQARWEMNGITYDLASTNVDREAFLAIAESITPLSQMDSTGFEPEDAPATQDPVEFVLAYRQALNDRDMDMVRNMLVEKFREFDDETLWRTAWYLTETEPGPDQNPENWSVEHSEHFTVVRYTNFPSLAHVLRQSETGEWLADRGASAYWSMQRMENDDNGDLLEGPGIERISDNLDTIDAHSLMQIIPVSVEPHSGSSIEVTIEWMLTGSLTAEVALDDLRWVAGDDSGAVEITWATARLADNSMEFPALPDGMDGSPTYTTTFTLYDIPEEGSFELYIPDMTVIDRDGNENHLTTIIHAPIAEYPQGSE